MMKEMHVHHRFSKTKNHIVQFPENFSLNIFEGYLEPLRLFIAFKHPGREFQSAIPA